MKLEEPEGLGPCLLEHLLDERSSQLQQFGACVAGKGRHDAGERPIGHGVRLSDPVEDRALCEVGPHGERIDDPGPPRRKPEVGH